jgi:hemoglobin
VAGFDYDDAIMSSIYERLGGEAAIQAAVVRFYEKVLADASVAPFFDGLDMDAQIRKQVAFMTLAFGGPHQYSGRDLRTAHAGLVSRGLGNMHFDAVVGHLQSTLDELGISGPLTAEVLTIVEGTRRDVLSL